MANDIFTQETVDKLNASALTFNEVVTSRAGGVSTGAIIDQTLTPLGEPTDTLKGRLDKIGPIITNWGSATGGTITTPAQAFLNNTVGSAGYGNYYAWTGGFPHVVAPGADPALPGSGYVPRSDVVLRDQIGLIIKSFDSISELSADTSLTQGSVVFIAGYSSRDDGAHHYRKISAANDGSGIAVGSLWANIIPDPDGIDVKWLGPDTTPQQIRLMLQYSAVFKNDVKLSSLSAAFSRWVGKQEYPIAFFGDSTTDGATTTGHVPSTPTVDGVSITESPNAYCKILEDAIKRAIPNYPSGQRIIYNAGFDSQSMANDFAIDKFDSIFIDSVAPFVNAKMIGFAWGVTDVINNNDPLSALSVYKRNLEALSIYALAKGRQPFLVSPVPMWVTGTNLRNGWQLLALIDEANKDIAARYNLEIISLRDAIELDTEKNGNPLSYFSADQIHPNDYGHSAIAGGLFAQMCPNVFTKDDVVACGSPNIMKNAYTANVVVKASIPTKYDFFFTEGTYRFFVYLDEPRVMVADSFNQGERYTITPTATSVVTSYNDKQTVNRNIFANSLDFYSGTFGTLIDSSEFVTKLPAGLSEIEFTIPTGRKLGSIAFKNDSYSLVENTSATNQKITQKLRDLKTFSKGLVAHDFDFDTSQYYLCKGTSTFTINAIGYNVLNSAICFNVASNMLRYNYIKLLVDKMEWWVVVNGVHTKKAESLKAAAFDTATLVNANNRIEISIASVVDSTSSADTVSIKVNGATAYDNLVSTAQTLLNIKQGWGVGLYDLDINGTLKTLSDVVVVSNK